MVSTSKICLSGPRLGVLMLLLAPALLRASEWPYGHRQGPFVFHADFPLEPYQALFADLEQLKVELSTQLQLRPNDETIDVYLFAQQRTYESYMQKYFPTVVPRRAMFIKANSPGNVFAYVSPQFAIDLRHECTHAILHTALPYVPLWLDEGLAEYYEVPPAAQYADNPHLSSLKRTIRWKRPTPIARLEAIDRLEDMGRTQYRDAWAWVHFMVHGPVSARNALLAYLREVEMTVRPVPLSERLQIAHPQLDQTLRDHFRKTK